MKKRIFLKFETVGVFVKNFVGGKILRWNGFKLQHLSGGKILLSFYKFGKGPGLIVMTLLDSVQIKVNDTVLAWLINRYFILFDTNLLDKSVVKHALKVQYEIANLKTRGSDSTWLRQ